MRLRHAVPFTLIAGIAGVACAGAALAPELSVMKAGAELGEARRAGYSLSLHADKKALQTFNEALVAAGSEEMETPEAFADSLAFIDSSLNVVWDKGDDDEALADDAIALRLDIDDMDDAVELRFLNGTLYARARARGIADYFEAPAGTIDQFLTDSAAPGLEFLKDAADGRWLAHDLDPIVSFLKGIVGNGTFDEAFREGAGFGLSDLRPEVLQDVVDSFADLYGNDVNVTKGKADGPGTHYLLTASARDLYQGIKPVIEDMPFLAKGLDGLPAGGLPAAGDIPDEDYSADVWVSDGKITRIEFDLAQLPPAGTFPDGIDMPRMTLRLDIDRSPAEVIAPGDAVKLDIFELIGKLAAGEGVDS
jgi:hypothetical protein